MRHNRCVAGCRVSMPLSAKEPSESRHVLNSESGHSRREVGPYQSSQGLKVGLNLVMSEKFFVSADSSLPLQNPERCD